MLVKNKKQNKTKKLLIIQKIYLKNNLYTVITIIMLLTLVSDFLPRQLQI